MPFGPSAFFSALGRFVPRRSSAEIRVDPLLLELSALPAEESLKRLITSADGLNPDEAARRLETAGPNAVAQERRLGWLHLLGRAVFNPLVVLLAILAVINAFTGDLSAAAVMTAMILLGVTLRFIQEARADSAAAKLKAMIRVTATVVRGGQSSEVPITELVPGDIVKLAAGDMIPADVRILSAKDLFVTQASLTGESLPVEKSDQSRPPTRAALEAADVCFLGTNVESGIGTAVVVATGFRTYLGGMAKSISGPTPPTSFDVGINRITWLMIRFMLVLMPLVFLINGFTKHNWMEAFFFSVAVAVGLTPEMLPMIVTVCLSKGALAMSRKKVIVKRLNSIQNFGAMDVLCTDKTGTLTMDKVILERHCDVVSQEDDGVLGMAYLNSYFQTGLKNVLDRAVLQFKEVHEDLRIPDHRKVDEIPFDFARKIMSVVLKTPEGAIEMISKGAPEEVFRRCVSFELDGQSYPVEPVILQDLREEYERLSADGFRVLALAYKTLAPKDVYSAADECDLTLKGYVAFLDPPKETALYAIKALREHGISIKVLTGDNELVSRKICGEVGIPTSEMLLGSQVEALTDDALAEAAERTTLFARVSPAHKQRIIVALRSRGHVVGYMGDGINDAPALRAADIGISVDTAVDIAKESADMILLEKSLMVLEEGVLEGRKVFANILKYIRMGASSNFGNMFSVLGASAFLPFLPMTPIQILTNNLLYDFSQVPIPTDDVDPELVKAPCAWSIKEITRFIVFIGPISSIFDYATYFIMLFVFKCRTPAGASLFQTGWFVESLLTQTLIIHIIRTRRVPFLQSRASLPLILTTAAVMAVGVGLPFSPLAPSLGLTRLPPLYWPILTALMAGYLVLTQTAKTWLLRKNWI